MIQETGDLLGAELTVIPQYQTAYVIFQCAEGAPADPVFVPAKIKGGTVEFTVNQEGGFCNGKYSATANAKGVRLSSDVSHGSTEFLPRRRSYWAQ